jgi:hypothetical protein
MLLDFSYMLCLLSMKFVWLSSEYDDPGQEVVSHEPVEQVEQGKHQREHPPKTGNGNLKKKLRTIFNTASSAAPQNGCWDRTQDRCNCIDKKEKKIFLIYSIRKFRVEQLQSHI